MATAYECMTLHVDSTGQSPSKAPSLALTQGVPLSLRLGMERKPITLELRLYSGAGIYGSFGKWPEGIFFDERPVDTLRPTPSLAFRYLPQQPPGEYSLVVRATWDGPIDVFYATNFMLSEKVGTGGIQGVTFDELFSRPDEYSGSEVVLTGFYFHGWETIVFSEKLEYTGRAEGHIWPQGQMCWIQDDLIPRDIYDQLDQQELIRPLERDGKLRIKGKFEYGGRYGHLGGFTAQIVPSEVELLSWSPPPEQR